MMHHPETEPHTQTADWQDAITPSDALRLLVDGNDRYVSAHMFDRDFGQQVSQTASGQYPFAIVCGCVDSRVPPEIIFDQGVGDIFAARVPGNVACPDVLGSMEYAVAIGGVKLIMILGHTECGAIKGACDHLELGNLTQSMAALAPVVESVRTDGPRDSGNQRFVDAVARANVEAGLRNVIQRSPVIRQLVERNEVMLVGAMYDVSTGRVELLEETAESSSADGEQGELP